MMLHQTTRNTLSFVRKSETEGKRDIQRVKYKERQREGGEREGERERERERGRERESRQLQYRGESISP